MGQNNRMLIKNGRVIDPGSGFDGLADLIINQGTIEKIVEREAGSEEIDELSFDETGFDEMIDAAGLIVEIGRAHV